MLKCVQGAVGGLVLAILPHGVVPAWNVWGWCRNGPHHFGPRSDLVHFKGQIVLSFFVLVWFGCCQIVGLVIIEGPGRREKTRGTPARKAGTGRNEPGAELAAICWIGAKTT